MYELYYCMRNFIILPIILKNIQRVKIYTGPSTVIQKSVQFKVIFFEKNPNLQKKRGFLIQNFKVGPPRVLKGSEWRVNFSIAE